MIEEPTPEEIHDDLASVYDSQALTHKVLQPGPKQFAAWHHPRKQYVRIHQWCVSVKQLIRDLKLPEGSVLNYLTLPGNELLDIRALSGVCDRERVKLRYLGFNNVQRGSSDQVELNLSRNEVSSLKPIDQFSHVEEDRLESLINTKSQGRAKMVDAGHFHAINLDLCDSIALKDTDAPGGSVLGALKEIILSQIASNKPWLLFITTKIESNLVSTRNREGLDNAIKENIRASQDFRDAFTRMLDSDQDRLEQDHQNSWQNSSSVLLKLFTTGLGKWLLRILAATQPRRSLKLLSACYYRSGTTPNMLSLAFRCDVSAQQLEDRDGIFQDDPPAMDIASEVELGIELAQAATAAIDLDELLSNDRELTEKLIAQSARLLATARYDELAYRDWVEQQLAAVA